jgi:hypothetical protein
MKGDYEEICALGRRKNKANSKPNKANLLIFSRKPEHRWPNNQWKAFAREGGYSKSGYSGKAI